MSRHNIALVAIVLFMAIVAAFADTKSAPAANSAPAPDSSSDDDLPDPLTPFAVSPSVAATIAEGPSGGDDDIENDPDAGTDGAPTSSDKYAKLDKKYSDAAPSVPLSSAAAAATLSAAAACLLF